MLCLIDHLSDLLSLLKPFMLRLLAFFGFASKHYPIQKPLSKGPQQTVASNQLNLGCLYSSTDTQFLYQMGNLLKHQYHGNPSHQHAQNHVAPMMLPFRARTLSDALEKLDDPYNNYLESINLYNDLIGDRGIIALASALRLTKAPVLNHLMLGKNMITDDGAIALADAIRHTSAPLDVIDLYCNSIGDRGAIALATAIRFTRAPIETFHLWDNKIGDDGGLAIECALRFNLTITNFSVMSNLISPTIVARIRKLTEDTPERRDDVDAFRQRYPDSVCLEDIMGIYDETGDNSADDVDMIDEILYVEI